MADAVVEIIDPLTKWGTPEWDQVLIELDNMTKEAEQTGQVGRDFNAINQLLNALAFVIGKFKLVREIELQSGSAARVAMVTTFFDPIISALELSAENFLADRTKILDRYRR